MPIDDIDNLTNSGRCALCGRRLPPDHGWDEICDHPTCQERSHREQDIDAALERVEVNLPKLTSQQINSLKDGPIEIAPAPGEGKALVIRRPQ